MLKDKLKYFFENHSDDRVFSTSDETLFVQKQDANVHSSTLEDNKVSEHLRTGSIPVETEKDTSVIVDNAGLQNKALEVAQQKVKEAGKKPSPAELKAIKEKATAEYTELFGTAPDSKLSGAKIQEMVDAKKAEPAKTQNPE